MKKNQLVVIVSLCILSLSCGKQSKIENVNTYSPQKVVKFDLSQRGYTFSGNEVITYHKPGDSLYGFLCKTNSMEFKFEFKCSGFDKDTLLILKGQDFRFWQDYFEYEAGENVFAIHCTNREGNLFTGYFTGHVTGYNFSNTYLGGNFALLYFKND